MYKIKKHALVLAFCVFETSMALSQNIRQRFDDVAIMVREDLKPSLEVIKQITVAVNCGVVEESGANLAILEIKNHMVVNIIFPSRIGPQQGIDVDKMIVESIERGKKIASEDFCKTTKPIWRARIVDTVRQLVQSSTVGRY